MYKALDTLMLYLVDVNVKYHHISIPKQCSKCIKRKELTAHISYKEMELIPY